MNPEEGSGAVTSPSKERGEVAQARLQNIYCNELRHCNWVETKVRSLFENTRQAESSES